MSNKKRIPLHWQVIIALVLGLVYAIMAIQFGWQDFTLSYIQPFGVIFINVLKMIAVPLVLFSIISGIVSLQNIKTIGSMGIKTLLLYVLTTMSAVCVGLLLVNLVQPGAKPDDSSRIEKRIEYEKWIQNNPEIPRLDTACFSCREENNALVQKIAGQNSDIDENVKDKLAKAESNDKKGPLQPIVDVIPDNIFVALADMQMLQIIFFALFFGITITLVSKRHADTMTNFIESANEIFVKMVDIIMITMPYFVFALMAGALVDSAGENLGKLVEMLSFLGWYSLTVVLGLLLMAFVFYPTLIQLFAKNMKARKFLKGIGKAQLTAFSTSSSVATLPVTMECVHQNLGIRKTTTSFVLPIGATVNMDGTSLYQAIAVVGMAQFHIVDLTLAQQGIIVLTATLASIGAAAVPSAGLVLMIVVLESVGLNPAWIAIILPVDRILDMCRTVVNVTGDATVSTIVDQWQKD